MLQATEQANREQAQALCSSSGAVCLVKPLEQEPLAASSLRPPGHRKTAAPFFHKKKRPVSVAQALYHMLLLVEKRGQGKKKKKARVIDFSLLSSKENTSPTLNKP